MVNFEQTSIIPLFNRTLISINSIIQAKERKKGYRLSSLKNDAVIAGLARNQDTGSQGFRGVSTVPRKITILPPSEDVSAREDRRSETERKRGAMELMEGGRSGGEFEVCAQRGRSRTFTVTDSVTFPNFGPLD